MGRPKGERESSLDDAKTNVKRIERPRPRALNPEAVGKKAAEKRFEATLAERGNTYKAGDVLPRLNARGEVEFWKVASISPEGHAKLESLDAAPGENTKSLHIDKKSLALEQMGFERFTEVGGHWDDMVAKLEAANPGAAARLEEARGEILSDAAEKTVRLRGTGESAEDEQELMRSAMAFLKGDNTAETVAPTDLDRVKGLSASGETRRKRGGKKGSEVGESTSELPAAVTNAFNERDAKASAVEVQRPEPSAIDPDAFDEPVSDFDTFRPRPRELPVADGPVRIPDAAISAPRETGVLDDIDKEIAELRKQADSVPGDEAKLFDSQIAELEQQRQTYLDSTVPKVNERQERGPRQEFADEQEYWDPDIQTPDGRWASTASEVTFAPETEVDPIEAFGAEPDEPTIEAPRNEWTGSGLGRREVTILPELNEVQSGLPEAKREPSELENVNAEIADLEAQIASMHGSEAAMLDEQLAELQQRRADLETAARLNTDLEVIDETPSANADREKLGAKEQDVDAEAATLRALQEKENHIARLSRTVDRMKDPDLQALLREKILVEKDSKQRLEREKGRLAQARETKQEAARKEKREAAQDAWFVNEQPDVYDMRGSGDYSVERDARDEVYLQDMAPEAKEIQGFTPGYAEVAKAFGESKEFIRLFHELEEKKLIDFTLDDISKAAPRNTLRGFLIPWGSTDRYIKLIARAVKKLNKLQAEEK